MAKPRCPKCGSDNVGHAIYQAGRMHCYACRKYFDLAVHRTRRSRRPKPEQRKALKHG